MTGGGIPDDGGRWGGMVEKWSVRTDEEGVHFVKLDLLASPFAGKAMYGAAMELKKFNEDRPFWSNRLRRTLENAMKIEGES